MKTLGMCTIVMLLAFLVGVLGGCAMYPVQPGESVQRDDTAPGRAAAMDSLRDQVLSTCDTDAKKGKKNGFDGRVTSNGDSYAAQYTGACQSGDETMLTKTPTPQQAVPFEVRRPSYGDEPYYGRSSRRRYPY